MHTLVEILAVTAQFPVGIGFGIWLQRRVLGPYVKKCDRPGVLHNWRPYGNDVYERCTRIGCGAKRVNPDSEMMRRFERELGGGNYP